MVDRYQQHEIPLVSVSVVQYDQHAVACGCGRMHTATRPAGAGTGRIEYGPNLRAYALYLLIVHFVPVHRVVEILTSLTGAAPSTGFVHSLLRPSKIQENISGRLTDPDRAKDRYLIRGVLSTAAKHAVNPLTVLRDAFTGTTWLPPAARA